MGSIADEGKVSRREGKKNRGAPVPDLLEEAWFFRKFIDGTTTTTSASAAVANAANSKPAVRSMGRCFSDPTSSQSVSLPPQPPPPPQSGGLARAPSLPPCVGRRSGELPDVGGGCCRKSAGRSQVGERDEMMMMMMRRRGKRGSRSEKGRNPGSLERAPSLPPWIGRSDEEEVVEDDDEIDMSMSRLIQQAMSCSLDDISIPKPATSSANSKVNNIKIKHSSSMKKETRDGSNSRRRIMPVANDAVVTNNSQTGVGDVHQGRKLKKTMSNLEIPRQRPNNNNDRCSPPIPTWAADSNAHLSEDIKAHLKVWARSVAANMH